MPPTPLHSLQFRIVALFLTLLVAVQAGTFLLIDTVGGKAARDVIEDGLTAGGTAFERLLDEDGQRLVQAAQLVAAEPALVVATAARDGNAAQIALAHAVRPIGAGVAMLVGLDDRVIARSNSPERGDRFASPKLLERARELRRADSLAILDGTLYRLAVVPVDAGAALAWVVLGRAVDDAYAQNLRGLTRLDVSILGRQADQAWSLHASTLPEAARLPLLADFAIAQAAADDRGEAATHGEEVVVRTLPLRAASDATVVAVLQHPLASTLEPFRRLQRMLAWTSLLALAVSIVAGVLVARSVARPVRELADAARRIAVGDYSLMPPRAAPQEIRELHAAFHTMQDDIMTREARILDLAYRDPLTGLPNRTLFNDKLAETLERAADLGTSAAVLVMDLDHFRYVNDALGHPIGDALLGEVAERLRAEVAHEGHTVARLGGDEFAILLPGATVGRAQRVAASLLAALERPFTPAEQIVDVRASIGIAVHPEHGREAATLLRHADVAMYAAKRTGGGAAVFDERQGGHSRERLALMRDLRKAVEAGELTLVYQPKIALAAASGHHVEALVRWRHPERGLVAPAEFIPFAEQTGYIRTITQWILAHAIAQCVSWRAEGLPMHVAINLSARDVMDAQLPERIAGLLAQRGCASQWISFEITESALLDDPGHAVANLERLHALGCRIAIDDFGTGYSSLAYLRRLPLSELKIDRSFVAGLASDADDAAIVRSTIDLAHDMRLSVVAEGVEDEPTLEQLRALGCDLAQGYLISRPLGPLQVAAWVRDSPWARAAAAGKSLRRVV